MISMVLIFGVAWTGVSGQFGTVAKPYIVNLGSRDCKCEIVENCPFDPKPGEQPRIDYLSRRPYSDCPKGYSICCKDQQANNKNTCGIRKIPATLDMTPGHKAKFGDYPWQAALLDRDKFIINPGILIDDQHILTSALKLTFLSVDLGNLIVQVGEWRQYGQPTYPQVQRGVAKITIHPDFDSETFANNLAIIRLSDKVILQDYPNVNTVCLPSTAPKPGTRCYLLMSDIPSTGPISPFESQMKDLELPIIDSDECQNRLEHIGPRPGGLLNFQLNKTREFCAGDEAIKDGCGGFPGTPLICQRSSGEWEVAGLVATGYCCRCPGISGIYVNVFNYLPWINDVISGAQIN